MELPQILHYIAGPLIGALIGYCTNYIAVKMLFHPHHEVKVFGHTLPFTPGGIPKNKPRLAHAIVVLAAKDYDAELDWFRQNPPRDEEDKQHETYLKHQTELQSLERFFRSGWFELLSGLDGEALMKKIQEGGIAR